MSETFVKLLLKIRKQEKVELKTLSEFSFTVSQFYISRYKPLSQADSSACPRHPSQLVEESAQLRDEHTGMLLLLQLTHKNHHHRTVEAAAQVSYISIPEAFKASCGDMFLSYHELTKKSLVWLKSLSTTFKYLLW